MILNVSGRTDIIAFYSNWFMKRYKEGFVDVRNPFNPKLVSRIYFDDVRAIFFCTKNPLPIIKFLKEIEKPIIFHITLTPYKEDIEPNVPNKIQIIEGIKEISKIIGKNLTVVRYDPVFISEKYSTFYHIKAFSKLCTILDGYIDKNIISFIDEYKNTLNNQKTINKREMIESDYQKLGISFSEEARKHNITVQTCFEERNLVEYGFVKGDCVSKELAFSLTNLEYKTQNIRKEKKCSCVQMVDIGVYNSCKHFCKYCYANFDEKKVNDNYKLHNPNSSLLIGDIKSDDIIKVRRK